MICNLKHHSHLKYWLLILTLILLLNSDILHADESQTLVNINTDQSGEPWIAGGVSKEEWNQSLYNVRALEINRSGLTKSLSLPLKTDNTHFQSFRPVFNQRGASCAQASGIGYVYTYEINYARNLSSQVTANQYPYDYTYNFLNNGDSLYGSTTIQGWYIVRAAGIPNALDYGGFGLGNFTQWISGYDKYYNGLSNRLKDYFSIYIRETSELYKMKQWLYDHGNGSSQGGCLVFCADADGQKIVSLAANTPEAGKKALISFGSGGGHAMTIAGYNDEIRYDYNNDGKYTNNIDLNGDKIIDVRDYETGAVLMVNSWGRRWQDSGKAYVMYKVLADSEDSGGIYSNQLIGITLEDQAVTIPKLTVKFTLSHSDRSKLKIKSGYSTSLSSTKPFTLKTFSSAFNRTGGSYPIQGISAAPLTACLDISEYYTATSGKTSTIYLVIESLSGKGTVSSFSVIDNTYDPPAEYICSDTNITIVNGTTTLKLIKPAVQLSQTTSVLAMPLGSESVKPALQIGKNLITINNCRSERITMYNLSGKAVNVPVAITGTDALLDISSLAKNSYIIKTGNYSGQFTLR